MVVFGAGSAEDYQRIVKSNRRKFYRSYDGGPFTIKYFIDNPSLSEVLNDSLIFHSIDTLNIGDSFVLQNIYFDFDKYILLNESFPILDGLADYLKTKQTIKILISGHTDNVGIKEYNDELSMKRAKSVVDYLIIKGIANNRLQSIGFGSEFPIDSNNTSFGRQQNRRIELKIVAK